MRGSWFEIERLNLHLQMRHRPQSDEAMRPRSASWTLGGEQSEPNAAVRLASGSPSLPTAPVPQRVSTERLAAMAKEDKRQRGARLS